MKNHITKLCAHCGKEYGPGKYPQNFKRSVVCSYECMHAKKKFSPEKRIAAFWAKVDKQEDGCWVYRGATDKWGYTHIGVEGRRKQAHRFSYELAHGTIPTGMLVLHSCDNPPCVNPAHLRLGTDADNRADAMARRRIAYGERTRRNKLTAEAAKAALALKGTCSQREAAEQFNVSQGAIQALWAGRSWRYL